MSSLPRRDRWVVTLVVLALAALIAGFAMSAPALRPERMGDLEVAGSPGGGDSAAGAAPSAIKLDSPARHSGDLDSER